VRAEGHNPLCGDEIQVYLDVKDGIVSDIKIGGQGCSISQSSASMMSAAVKGKPVAEIRNLVRRFKHMMSIEEDETVSEPIDESQPLGDLEALRGVVKFPVRIKCATLSWNTLLDALEQSN
jgi:nitrogen fixation NifU-like protein